MIDWSVSLSNTSASKFNVDFSREVRIIVGSSRAAGSSETAVLFNDEFTSCEMFAEEFAELVHPAVIRTKEKLNDSIMYIGKIFVFFINLILCILVILI